MDHRCITHNAPAGDPRWARSAGYPMGMQTLTASSPIPQRPLSPRALGGIPALGMASALLALLGLACGDDTGGGGAGGGGGSGPNTTSTTTTTGSGGGAATTSSAGGGGEGGATGAGGAGEGGAGGAASAIECELFQGTEYCSTDCASLPQTLATTAGIEANMRGAVVCQSPSTCTVTSNTFSNGPFPCAFDDTLIGVSYNANTTLARLFSSSNRHFTSASHGTINSEFPNEINGAPGGTTMTLVVNDGPSANPSADDYTVVLRIDATTITVTSVTKN